MPTLRDCISHWETDEKRGETKGTQSCIEGSAEEDTVKEDQVHIRSEWSSGPSSCCSRDTLLTCCCQWMTVTRCFRACCWESRVCTKMGWMSSPHVDQTLDQDARISSVIDWMACKDLFNLEIAAELRAYICSNEWVTDPEKLSKFSKDQLVPKAAEEYLCLITKEEMPWGLKKYMELELFPHIHLRVGCGISLATAQRWLHSEGFRYTTHKKSLYFDGHDHADVVEYRQRSSCLQWKLMSHGWSNMWWEMLTKSLSYHAIILLSATLFLYHKMRWHHKPMTSWRRCGFIRMSIVCARRGLVMGFTKVIPFVQQLGGWRKGCKPLNMARTMMVIGMGSNLWNRSDLGSIVCHHYWWIFEQLKERIIPAFKKAHGAGYQALIMVNNSQGHSAYSPDTLLVSWMNVNPGGKQGILWDGWYTRDGQKVVQPMVFPHDHWKCSLILWSRNPWSKKSLKRQVIFALYCPNSTVSWILLNSSGVQSKNTSMITVITLSTHWRRTRQKHWNQSNYQQSRNGSTGSSSGWMPIGQVWELLKLRSRWRRTVPRFTLLTAMLWRQSLAPLTSNYSGFSCHMLMTNNFI